MAASGHITPELFKFFRALKKNNNKAWFEKNKPRYLEHVRDPLLEFISEFAPRLHKLSPHLVAESSIARESGRKIPRRGDADAGLRRIAVISFKVRPPLRDRFAGIQTLFLWIPEATLRRRRVPA